MSDDMKHGNPHEGNDQETQEGGRMDSEDAVAAGDPNADCATASGTDVVESDGSAGLDGDEESGLIRVDDHSAPVSHTPAEFLGRGIRRVVQTIRRIEHFISGDYKAQYGIAVTRMLMGITGIGLLLTNWNARFYVFGHAYAWSGEISSPPSDFPDIWLFSLFRLLQPSNLLLSLGMIMLGALAVTIVLGWRTRIILPIYLVTWVGFIELNDASGDQGDNAYRMMLVAMLFANTTLKWSLDERRSRRNGYVHGYRRPGATWALATAHNFALLAMAFQVCSIYMSGGMYKAAGDPWKHGYAIYNPLQTAQFGTWPVLSDLLTAWGPGVVIVTWGTLLFQLSFPFLLFNRYTRIIGLLGISSFHLGIAVLMGLPWFSLAMMAVDAIFIRDRSYARVSKFLTAQWSRMKEAARADEQAGNERNREKIVV